jgi:hypothetical protein
VTRAAVFVLVTFGFAVLSPPAALAQGGGAARPYRGLFGGGEGRSGGDGLNLTATLVEAYDDNLLAESGPASPDAPAVSGFYTMLQAGTDFSWSTPRLHIGASSTSAWRYYDPSGQVRNVSHSAGFGFGATVSERTRLFVNQSIAYSPSYLFGLFSDVAVGTPTPGIGEPAAPDYKVNDLVSSSYGTTATFNRGLTRRASVAVHVDYSFTDFNEANGLADMTSYGSAVEFSSSVGRRTALKTAYRYHSGDYSQVRGRAAEHGVDVSFDHTQLLSASRRAQFGLRMGVARMELPLEGLQGAGRGRLYRLVGNASVSYELSRSWRVRGSYQRGLEYVAELTEPVFVDAITAAADGLLTRRLEFSTTAGYSSGRSLMSSATPFDTYTAGVRGRFAASRTVALHLEYLYYFYDFGRSGVLAPGLSPRLERNGIRGGLTLWVPAFRKATRAAR